MKKPLNPDNAEVCENMKRRVKKFWLFLTPLFINNSKIT